MSDAAVFAACETWFQSYADTFRDARGALAPLLQLKVDHTARVTADAKIIATGLGWDEPAVHRARLAGLLHDVGRFPQWREYQSFYDPRTCNHAARGAAELKRADVLALLDADDRRALLSAVCYHNQKDIPDGLPPLDLELLRLVRDADKLDIFKVMHDAIATDQIRTDPELLWGIDPDGPPSDAMLEEIESNILPNYEHVNTLADYLLVQLGWLYDLNTVPAVHLVVERGIVDTMADLLPTHPAIDQALTVSRLYCDRVSGMNGWVVPRNQALREECRQQVLR